MKKTLFVSLIVAAFCSAQSGYAQIPVCPTNIDFELGTSDWNYYIGTCCPIVANTPTAPISCRHTLTSATGLVACTEAGSGATDQYGGFPIVTPGSGTQSLRLGNTVNGAQAEKARYYVTVPTGTSSYCLVYKYAVVFQNPSHAPSMQPRFETNAYDTTTGWSALPGAHHTYVAGGVLPGFLINNTCSTCIPPTTMTQPVQYTGWNTATIDLTGLGGHVVAVDFMNGDCSPAGHFSYSYIDVSCDLFEISAMVSCDTSWVELTAPAGYESFSWYNSSSFASPVGSGMATWVPVSSVPETYAVILTPYTGFGPADTLYSTIVCALCSGTPTPGTVGADSVLVGSGTTVDLSLPGYPLVTGLTYQWQSSADSTAWTNISGATDSVYSFSGLTATTFFRCKITCTVSGLVTLTPGKKIVYSSSVITSTINYPDGPATIFPNPACDELNIKSESGVYSSFTITNAVGKQLINQKLSGTQTKVSLKSLPSGFYYISLKGEGGSEIQKFIKR